MFDTLTLVHGLSPLQLMWRGMLLTYTSCHAIKYSAQNNKSRCIVNHPTKFIAANHCSATYKSCNYKSSLRYVLDKLPTSSIRGIIMTLPCHQEPSSCWTITLSNRVGFRHPWYAPAVRASLRLRLIFCHARTSQSIILLEQKLKIRQWWIIE